MPSSGFGLTAGSNHPSICSLERERGIPLQNGPPSQSYITHFWDFQTLLPSSLSTGSSTDVHSVTLLESRTTIESGTTGLRTWMASFVLARYLILHPELVTSKRVLELGSGIGFLAIIVASLQCLQNPSVDTALSKSSLWITDINDEVLARCRDNINLPCNLSSSHPDIHYRNLDWSQSMDADDSCLKALIHEKIDPDLILGADIIFDPQLIPSLVGTLEIALRPSKGSRKAKVSIIALTMRNEDTLGQFLAQLRESSLHVEEMDTGSKDTCFYETIEASSYAQHIKMFRVTYV
ncbi:hypothetical protein M413DRAFT_205482 [Hebeloma cylindrosporum]|uniref:FAM86 N-terminal domain-containing protein n=1 Tax=Hebeloma cylindrosporum TaxID=76867 RepID=A0A0C2YCW7_HEBCY|nr:hypothetical protein M413DRAFT_205482 [Hebeloma cylindrosporum h7]